MRKLLVLLVCVSPFLLFGMSETDSLKQVLSTANGEEKVNSLLDLQEGCPPGDSVCQLGYIREAIREAKQLNRPGLVAKALFRQGEVYFNFAEFHRAIECYRLSMEYFQKAGDSSLIGELFNDIGLSYYYLSEYEKAIESQIEAVKNFEQNGNEADLARIYINMGMVYNRLTDYDSALGYYRKAAVISRKINHPDRMGNSFNGLGTVFFNSGQLDSAKVYYHQALKWFNVSKNRERLGAVINNLGNIYLVEGDSLTIGLAYYQQAFSIYEELGNQRNKVFVMEGMGGTYSALGNQKKALELLTDGLRLALENNYGYYIIHLFYQDISVVFERMGKIEPAFESYKNYKIYLDSMRQEERLFQAAAIEKKYEFSKNEALISKLNTEKELAMIQIEKDRAFRNLGVFAILILLIIVTYVSFANFQRRRINRQLTQKNAQIEAHKNELEQLNASKNKFFSIIAHDLKNPLHTVLGYSFLLHHEYDRFGDSERKRYAKDIYSSTNNIFRLLQNLLDWSRAQTGRLVYEPVSFELSTLIEKINLLLKPVADEKNISITNRVSSPVQVYAMPMMVETVVRNLISNAIKFTPDGGRIEISHRCSGPTTIISVSDTGIGLSKQELDQLFEIDSKIRKKGTKNEDGSGLGLILCKEFIMLNKGRIWAESEKAQGSTFKFTIPLDTAYSNQ